MEGNSTKRRIFHFDTAESTNRLHCICSPRKLQILYNSVRTPSTIVNLTRNKTKSFNTLSMTKFSLFLRHIVCVLRRKERAIHLLPVLFYTRFHTPRRNSHLLFCSGKRIKIARILAKLCTTREQDKFRECSVPFRPEIFVLPFAI
jgi:hypothetical protein